MKRPPPELMYFSSKNSCSAQNVKPKNTSLKALCAYIVRGNTKFKDYFLYRGLRASYQDYEALY